MTVSTLSSPVSAAPRYATSRDPRLETFGPHVDKVAAALGHPPMPSQQLINAVANEIITDPITGLWVYKHDIVVVSLPRRGGKTTTLGANQVHRALTMQDHRAWYTAQSGQDARDQWREWQQGLAGTMPGRWKFRQSNGEETATYPPTGSFIRTFPPTPDALHGKAVDMPALDEVWALTMTQGTALTQAVIPTMATRPRAQLWILSTAGAETSVWFRSWIERARASLDDPDSPIAYFEWSFPDDVDITDPTTWAAHHPAYGITINQRSMQAALNAMGEEQFSRAFGNRWPAVSASWRAGWPLLTSTDRIPVDARVFLAADAQQDQRSAAITAAAVLPDGRVAVEVIDHRSGVDWLVPRLAELTRKHRAPVAILRTGPIGYVLQELEGRGVRSVTVTPTEYADAAARIRTLTVAGGIAHPGDPRLDRAVDAVDTRDTGDRYVWKRKDATVDICPLIAASLSIWQASVPTVRPRIVVA